MAARGTDRWSDWSKVMSQIMANLVMKQRFCLSCVSALRYLAPCASLRASIAHYKTCSSLRIASWGSTAAQQPHPCIHLGTDLRKSFCFSESWLLLASLLFSLSVVETWMPFRIALRELLYSRWYFSFNTPRMRGVGVDLQHPLLFECWAFMKLCKRASHFGSIL